LIEAGWMTISAWNHEECSWAGRPGWLLDGHRGFAGRLWLPPGAGSWLRILLAVQDRGWQCHPKSASSQTVSASVWAEWSWCPMWSWRSARTAGGVSHCGVKLGSQAFQFLVSRTVYPDTRTMHANQQTPTGWLTDDAPFLSSALLGPIPGGPLVPLARLWALTPFGRAQDRRPRAVL